MSRRGCVGKRVYDDRALCAGAFLEAIEFFY